jgi:hypothetical protein
LGTCGQSPRAGPIPTHWSPPPRPYLGTLNKLMIKRQKGQLDTVAAQQRRIHSTEAV